MSPEYPHVPGIPVNLYYVPGISYRRKIDHTEQATEKRGHDLVVSPDDFLMLELSMLYPEYPNCRIA